MVNRYPSYLIHHGVKGMKWGIRREEKRAAKKRYKNTKKTLIAQRKTIDKSYRDALKRNKNKKKQFEKTTKEAYKQGKFSKERYKTYKKLNRDNYWESNEKLNSSRLVGQYKVNKMLKANKAILVKDIKGTNSNKYERAVRSVARSVEYYGDYEIRENKDGTYKITRYQYFY